MVQFDFAFWYTAVLIAGMTIALVRELYEPDIIIFSVLILLVAGGVIDVKESFAGFSNTGMLTVGFLFIVAGALQKTGVLNQLGVLLLGGIGRLESKFIRLLLPVSVFSAFFNNTPIVAMFIPVIRFWARKYDYPVSKFMIPLSYAAILGGTCTLIGTSTTLVVHGLMLQNGLRGMDFFEITPVGLPVALIGILTLSLAGHRLLPRRGEPMRELGEQTREFVIEMKVEPEYRHIGRTIEEAGLRHLKGLYLFQIERGGDVLATVGPREKILKGDRLFFTGLPETIVDLQRTPGLSLIKDHTFDLKNYDSDELGTYEVVISANSPLIGKNVRESHFRSRYNAVILAIHRSGERIEKKIGDIVLHAGDTLLILAQGDFIKKWYHSRDFYLVSKSSSPPSKPQWYSVFSISVLAAMIIAMATGVVPILIAVCAAALILILAKCISPEDARDSVDWSVLVVIASALGISKAVDQSGVAHFIASTLISAVGSLGVIGLLTAVYFTTSLYTEIITNNAAAALVFPIALALTQQTGLDPRPFLIAVAIAASASFATPIGYQTNLMVYGPGGYRFRDYLRIGIPMNLFIGFLAISIIYLIYFTPVG